MMNIFKIDNRHDSLFLKKFEYTYSIPIEFYYSHTSRKITIGNLIVIQFTI